MKKKFSILIADKNKNVLDFLSRELSSEGYEVVTAKDGNRLLREIDGENLPDLLVLDVEIPDIQGSAVLEKAQSRNPPLPVIVHTFLVAEGERTSDGDVYMMKSGNIDYLKSAIADTLARFYPERDP
jgi:CheY-like chemotaxis protein